MPCVCVLVVRLEEEGNIISPLELKYTASYYIVTYRPVIIIRNQSAYYTDNGHGHRLE